MKKSLSFTLLFAGLALFSNAQSGKSQLNNTGVSASQEPSPAKMQYVQEQNYLSANSMVGFKNVYGDSLNGFNELKIKHELLAKGIQGWEAAIYIQTLKRDFINEKYALVKKQEVINTPIFNNNNNTGSKKTGIGAVINATPCVNEDFELSPSGTYAAFNSVAGWTLQSRLANSGGNACGTNWNPGSPTFSILTTPFVWPIIGTIPHSPLGGTQVARLNNSATGDYNQTRLFQSFPVTNNNTLFQFAYAGYWQDGGGGHGCCDQPGIGFRMYDCSGNPLACSSLSLFPGVGCQSSGVTYTLQGTTASWTNWQVKYIDLTPYIGGCVTIEVMTTDCAFGGHYGTTFFDSRCGGQLLANVPGLGGTGSNIAGPVSFCAGSNIAQISAPLGYAAYQWVSPITGTIPAPQGTMATLAVQNPIPGTVYTVNLTSPSGCQYVATNTIVFSQVNIAGIGSSSTCANGASGSATVLGNGSGSGYNYTWVNSTNSVVGTGSVALNLAAGVYSVTITGIGAAGCGSATAATTVNVAPPGVLPLFKPFCGSQAFLITAGGSNFKWYNGMTPIPAIQGGNSSSYTVNPAVNGAIYRLSYLSSQGCQDSVEYTLNASTPGNIAVQNISWSCPGVGNATAAIVMSPAAGAPPGINAFTVTNGNAATPVYNSSVFPTPFNTYTVGGLAAGNYLVNAFDGSCRYTTNFNVSAFQFGYNMTPSTATLCQGNNIAAGVAFTSGPTTGYQYTWTPTTFMMAGTGNSQSTFLTPTAAPGQSATLIYTVVVTPTVVNCPITKTLSLTYVNPPTPTISAIPNMCDNGAPFQINTTPSGGSFITPITGTANPISPTGLISPNLSSTVSAASNTFTYSIMVNICAATQTANYEVSRYNPATLTSSVPPLCVNNPAFNLMNIVQSAANGSWSSVGGAGVTSSGPGAYSFNPAGLSTGNYILTYSTTSSPNATVCPASSNLTVSVTQTVVPTIVLPQAFCTNAPSFTMTASPSGGTWGGNQGLNTAGVITPSNLALTNARVNYSVTIGPCVNSNTANLVFSQFNPAILTGAVPEQCANNNISFNLNTIVQNTANGTWYDQATMNPIANNLFSSSGKLTGNYVLTYSRVSTPNAALCPDSKTISVSVLNPQIPVISQVGPFCNKDGNVQLTVNQTNGNWSTSAYLSSTGVLTPSLCAIGNNPVQYIVGTNTCNAQETKFISVEAFVPATISAPIPDQCNTGSATNLLPFTTSGTGVWSGTGIAGTNFNPSIAGSGRFELTYKTSSSPSGLCPDQSTIAVNVYSLAPPVINLNKTSICNTEPSFQLDVSPVGGLFGSMNGALVTNKGLINPALGVIGDNMITYSVSVGPCIAYAQTTVVIEKFVSAEFVSMPKKAVYCVNDESFDMMELALNPGGTWVRGTETLSSSYFNPKELGSGVHTFYYKTGKSDNVYCNHTNTLNIKVASAPKVSVSTNTAQGCAPYNVVLTPKIDATGGTATWYMGDDSEPITDINVSHTYKKAGTYTATLKYVSAEGCAAEPVEATPAIVVHQAPVANFSVPDEIYISNPEVQFTNLSSSLGDNRYQWKIQGMYSVNDVNPTVKFNKAGKYPVTLIAEPLHGACKTEITKTIEIKNDFNIYIPSSFTPNGDNLNDVFMPVFSEYGLDTKTFEMEIFDRWGHSLFRTKDVTKGWDGTINTKGDTVKEEVYIYKIKYKDVDGNLYSKVGHLSLVK